MAEQRTGERPDVELRVPATSAYAAVVRTTAAALAARQDFTVDEIEDLRIAIGEASALLLPEADPGTDLGCGFRVGSGVLTVVMDVEAVDEPEVDRDSFAWQVLDTMAEDVTAEAREGRLEVRFTLRSQVRPGADAQPEGAEL